MNESMIMVSNGDLHPLHLCVELHDGTWELESDCTCTDMEGCWALHDDVYTEYFGSTYLEDNNDVVYSSYHDEAIDTTHDNCRYGYINSGNREGYFCNDDYVSYDGDYYADSDVAEEHGITWSERHDEYIRGGDSQECNASYQSLSRRDKSTNNTEYRIGFEVEKEDEDTFEILYSPLYDRTGWGKEDDGSLQDGGYELVSPTFDLFTNDIDKDLEDKDLITLINGDYSDRCGGHINVSSTNHSPDELFEGMSGFIPLLYSMYEHRLDKTFSKAKKKQEYFYSRDKYSSFYIKNNRVEIRLPSAVRSVRNLLWRRDLIRIIMNNINASEVDVIKMMVSQNSKLYKHLRVIYTQSEVMTKISKFIMYSKLYNNKVLKPVDMSKIKTDGLPNEIHPSQAA